MQFLIDISIALLTTYLAFTNQLADLVIRYLPSVEEQTLTQNETNSQIAEIQLLPSIFKADGLPDILLRSNKYQQASVIAASDDENDNFVTDPKEALVNIFCTFTTDSTIRTTTGTGFFVHQAGVIMTNAHVAQYLLLGATNLLGEAECLVRQGTPAQPKYRANLLYIPPTWIQENAELITASTPTGTGERDYALLYVTEAVSGGSLPEIFPALAINADLLPRTIKGTEVQAAGYPATNLFRSGSNGDLLSISATTTVSEVYTFGSNYADVFSVLGSEVGGAGSSGGPVLNTDREVIGIIVTKGDDEVDGAGSLRAITMSHIHRTILEETGFSLSNNISGDLDYRAAVFTDTLAPFMTGLLSEKLNN